MANLRGGPCAVPAGITLCCVSFRLGKYQEGNNPENQILAYKTRLRATVAPGCSAAPGGGAQGRGGAEGCSPARSQRGEEKKNKNEEV